MGPSSALRAWERAAPDILNVRCGCVADDLGQVGVLFDKALQPAAPEPGHVLPYEDLRVTVCTGADANGGDVEVSGHLCCQVTRHHLQNDGEGACFGHGVRVGQQP
jgi:hypothetical protein